MREAIQHKPIVMIRFSEIAIKSSKTRRWLTQRLVDHIKYVLSLKNIQNFEVINDYSRLYIVSDDSKRVSEYIASLIPGTASLSIVYKVDTDIEEIKKIIDEFYRNEIRESSSFSVRVRRTGDHSFTSVELAAKIGEYIINSNSDVQLKVNLTNPDYTLHLDVRGATTYIFDNFKVGLGGLPVGCQGNVMVLVKGEEEDIANIIQLYKRGAHTIVYSLEKKEILDEKFLEKISELLVLQLKRSKLQHKILFIENEFDIQKILEIYKKYDCKGISISKTMFNEFSSLIPVSIPLFVPHIASEINRKDLDILV